MNYIRENLEDNICKVTYSSKLRLLMEDAPYSHTICIGVWIKTGSANETIDNNGISHFVEHLLFKCYDPKLSNQAISFLEAVGGQINAFTEREYTCFSIRILEEDLAIALNFISNLLCNRRFLEGDIEQEKKVVLEEIQKKSYSVDELMLNKICKLAWGNNPLSFPIVGTKENVTNIRTADILNYLENFYTLDNIVISIVGKLKDTKGIIDTIGELFSPLERRVEERRSNQAIPIKSGIEYEYRNMNQAYLCLGFQGVGYRDQDNISTMSVLNALLNGGITGILPRIVKEEHGLAYSLTTHRWSYENNGLFAIYTCTNPHNLKQLYEVILQQLDILTRQTVDINLLNMAKKKVINDFYFNMEYMKFRMTRIAQAEMFIDTIQPVTEVVNNINEVSLEDVLSLSKNIFREDKMITSIIAPMKEEAIGHRTER